MPKGTLVIWELAGPKVDCSLQLASLLLRSRKESGTRCSPSFCFVHALQNATAWSARKSGGILLVIPRVGMWGFCRDHRTRALRENYERYCRPASIANRKLSLSKVFFNFLYSHSRGVQKQNKKRYNSALPPNSHPLGYWRRALSLRFICFIQRYWTWHHSNSFSVRAAVIVNELFSYCQEKNITHSCCMVVSGV